MPVEVRVIEDLVPAIKIRVESVARAAVKKVAEDIARDARQLVPVDTGDLQASITTESLTAGKEAEVQVGEDYAGFVEFGTVKMAAQPYLGPAAEQHENDVAEIILGAIEEV